MAADNDWAPLPSVDIRTSSPARVYDYLLGGKNNFTADRNAAEHLLGLVPEGKAAMRANRAFLARAVRFLATAGISQFVDIGSGLPTQGNVHEIAQEVNPEAHVVYVDNDPIVLAHSRGLLENNSRATVIAGDMLRPDEIMAEPRLNELIDWNQPVAMLLVAVLHFVTDQQHPAGVVRAFADRMASGSHLVISHDTTEGRDPGFVATIKQVYDASVPTGVTFRDKAQIEGLMDGFALLEPGVAPVSQWRPDADTRPTAGGDWMLGGIGVKP